MHLEIRIEGMQCSGCVESVQNALHARDGVSHAVADLDAGKVTVDFDDAVIGLDGLHEAIEDAGFDVAAA